jgi:hypothetical protein
MNVLHIVRKELLGTALAAACGMAAADPSVVAESQISNLQFGVIDLTPSDGQAAGITINGEEGMVSRYLVDRSPGGLERHDIRSISKGMSETVFYTSGPSFAGFSYDQVGSMKAGIAAYDNLAVGGDTGASVFRNYTVTIAPHSVLTVRGEASTSIARTDVGTYDSLGYVSAAALIKTWEGTFTVFRHFVDTTPDSGGESWSENFFLMYANPSDGDMKVLVDTYVAAAGMIVSSIPEPSAYAMFAAGLMLLGALRRQSC